MKTLYIKDILFILCITVLLSCTKEIIVNIAHTPQTVIYGSISNQTAPVTIFIQQSVSVNSTSKFTPVNNAVVSLRTKNSNGIEQLITNNFSVNKGVYTSSQPITTIIGNKYWIEVRLSNGTQFKSDEEILNPLVTIDNIEILNEKSIAKVTFKDPADSINFYSVSVTLFNLDEQISKATTASNDVVFNGNEKATIEAALFSNSSNENVIIPAFTNIRTSLNNISHKSYQFLLNTRLQIDSNDGKSGDPSQLFSTPPVSLLGNITNTTTNQTALGNFTVRSVSIVKQQNKSIIK